MDGALSSSRYSGGGGSDDRRFQPRGGGGRGGGGYRRGGGRGGGGGGGRQYQPRDQNRHQPYQHRSGGGGHRHRGGGGGGGSSGNRFSASSDRRDTGILVQLSAMLSRVGDVTTATGGTDVPNDGSMITMLPRPEVTLVAKNISDLAAVIANPNNLKTFFEYNNKPSGPLVRTDVDMNNYYQNTSSYYGGANASTSTSSSSSHTTTIPAKEEAGLLAHLLVSCASTLVLHTPAYAALTLALHEASKTPNQGEYAGFAARCVVYAMQLFSRDLDILLLESLSPKQQQQQQAEESGVITQVQRAKAACRLKLLLRYFCLLGRLNILQLFQDQDQSSSSSSSDFHPGEKLSLLGLFQLLMGMATRFMATVDASPHLSSLASAAYVLASLVLSNLPYLIACDIPMALITESLLQPLESLMAQYQKASPFTPGFGSTAILLKDEPCDEEGDDDNDDEEDDEEEENGTDAQQPQPVCDSLQDMWRTIQNVSKQISESNGDMGVARVIASSSKFALLSDDPWNHIRISSGGDDNDNNINNDEAVVDQQVAFVELPLYLSFAPDCRAVLILLPPNDPSSSSTVQQLGQHLTLDGIIFGRLPIFGSPRSPGEVDEEEEEDMEGESSANAQQPESLLAYQREFSWNDRCLVAEAVRDCVLSYESTVSSSGIERGTAKDVAERIWSIQQAWNQESDHFAHKKGLEYAILESLVSLIVQKPVMDQGVVRQVYVSRVLLELTRLQPTAVPQALAMAVSNLFQDYMPSLAPYARDNLCRWFAFHLINTDYQWPAAYWRHWTTFVVRDTDSSLKANSRSMFVQRVLTYLSSNVHDLQRLSQECLPSGSELSRYLLPHATIPTSITDGSIASLEQELQERLKTEDPDSLSDYLIGGELSETVATSLGHDSGDDWPRTWWRTLVITRVLLKPAAEEHLRLKAFVEKAMEQQGTNEEMVLDGGDGIASTQGDEDMVALLLEALPRFRSVILAALSKDGEALAEQQSLGGSDSMTDCNIVAFGEDCLLQTVHSITYYSRTVLETVVECLLKHKLVSAMSVLRWVLSDSGRHRGESTTTINIVERWWELAALAARVSSAGKLASNGSSDMVGDGIGMMVDATGDDATTGADKSPAKLLLDELTPLLQYAVQQVHTLLSKTAQDGSKKKLTGSQIELIEGVKYFVLSAHSLYFATREIQQSNAEGNAATEQQQVLLEEMLAQSTVSGAKLSNACAQLGSGNFATNSLAGVLERI